MNINDIDAVCKMPYRPRYADLCFDMMFALGDAVEVSAQCTFRNERDHNDFLRCMTKIRNNLRTLMTDEEGEECCCSRAAVLILRDHVSTTLRGIYNRMVINEGMTGGVFHLDHVIQRLDVAEGVARQIIHFLTWAGSGIYLNN